MMRVKSVSLPQHTHIMNILITRTEKTAYSETFIQNQIAGLRRLARVVTIHSGRLPGRHEDDSPLNTRFDRFMGTVVKGLRGGERNNAFTDKGILKLIEKERIDIVLGNYGQSASHLLPICRKAGIPLIPHFHGHDATRRSFITEYKKKYTELFAFAPAIIAVSNVMKEKLVALGADAAKVKVIPYGVNLERFRLPESDTPKELIFLAVGRFTLKKAPLTTIRAFAETLEQFPEARLVMIGGKEGQYARCAELAAELGLQEKIDFTGVLSADEIAAWMRRAFAFVQHSVTAADGDMEGTPNSVLEASACGLPVISTRHGGIIDAVIEGETGLLVDEGDGEGMARNMIELARNRERAAQMGRKAREHIMQNYEAEKQIRKLFDVLSAAVSR